LSKKNFIPNIRRKVAVRGTFAYFVRKKQNGIIPAKIAVILFMGRVITYRFSKNRNSVRFSAIARDGYQ